MKITTKTYEENGIRYQFDATKLKTFIGKRKYDLRTRGESSSQTKIIEEIADLFNLSTEAVKNWIYGYNAPSDIEQVRVLGDFFRTDFHQLLIKESDLMQNNTERNENQLSEYQEMRTKDSVRDVYHAMLRYFKKCKYYFYDLKSDDTDYKKSNEFRSAVKRALSDMEEDYARILDTLEMAMLDIPRNFYKTLQEYLWVEMSGISAGVIPVEYYGFDDDERVFNEEKGDEYYIEFFDGGCMSDMSMLFENYMVNRLDPEVHKTY